MDDIDRLSLDFAARHPDSFARILGRGAFDECETVIESLPADRKAAIVARLPADRIRQLLDSERHAVTDWLIDAPFGDVVALLSRISRERRLALVKNIGDPNRRRQLLRFLQYPAHSVGALAVDIPLRLTAESLAKDVVDELRELDADAAGPVVIIDANGRYRGVLDRLQLLLRNPPTGQVDDYRVAVKAVRPETPVTAAATIDAWHTRNWLPVIDYRDRVVGAVSREKVFRAAASYTGGAMGGGDVLLDLLADLVYLCETALLKAISGNGAT
jgi:Mg/Co/Ni transporter MgtE